MTSLEQPKSSCNDVRLLQTETRAFEPSCIAFVPDDSGYFIVGTYHLHQASASIGDLLEKGGEGRPQSRSGSLTVHRLQGEEM